MHWLLRIVLAIVAGALATGVLDYFNLLNHALNVLIGLVVAIVVYLNLDGNTVIH